jgi:hypothetical protein
MPLQMLLPHCLEARRKILAVSSVEAHQGPSQFRVFPRTLSIVLYSIWDVIIDVGDYTEDTDGFNEALQMFIASHCRTAEDRHDLVQQLREPHKPPEVNCQPFHYRLLELNTYVEWTPGTKEFLTEDQLRHDCMPGPWYDKFVNTGKVVSDLTIAEHTRYFRQQEKLLLQKRHNNAQSQRHDVTKRRTPSRSPKHTNGSKTPKVSPQRTTTKQQPTHIGPEDPCTYHVGHKWGKCIDNGKNPDREDILREIKAKRENDENKKHESNSGDGFGVEQQYNSSTDDNGNSSDGDEDSVGPVLNINAHIPRKGTKRQNKSKCFRKDFHGCTTTEIFAHHIDIVTPSFTQNENSIYESESYADCYMSYISDYYRQAEEPVTTSELRRKNAIKKTCI